MDLEGDGGPISSVRAELAELRKEFSRLDQQLTHGFTTERRLIQLQTAMLLIILAHGFKWL